MFERTRALIKNEYFFSISTKICSISLGIIQSILIARYLGAELKGITAYISSVSSIISIILTYGMYQSYPYLRKKYGKNKIYDDFISLIVLVYSFYLVIATIIIFTCSIELDYKAIIFIAPILGYSTVIEYINLIENPNQKNMWFTIINLFEIIYCFVLFVFIDRNFFLAISTLLFAHLMKSIIYTITLAPTLKLSSNAIALFKEMLSLGFYPMIATLMTTLNYRIDIMMLAQYEFVTSAMVGIYSLGISLSEKIVLIPDTLKGILVSKLAKGASEEEVAKVCRIGIWSSILVCCAVLLVGKEVINDFYGLEYAGAYSIIVINVAGVLSVVYFKVIAQYNVIKKKQVINVIMLSIAVLIDVILNVIFIPRCGVQGAAFATCIGNVVCGIVFAIYFRRISGIPCKRMFFICKSDFSINSK